MTMVEHQKKYIIILDPAGDAKKTGRAINDSFERGLTLQCVEKIKFYLEQRMPHVKVIISRQPGDIVSELHNASLSNRLGADLFIRLHFYQTTDTKPTLFLYTFACDNDFAQYQHGLALNTYDQAYKINKSVTDTIAQQCMHHLSQQQYATLFSVAGPHALPIKELAGIIAPSVCIEMGLKHKDMWKLYVEPLTCSIAHAIEQLKKSS